MTVGDLEVGDVFYYIKEEKLIGPLQICYIPEKGNYYRAIHITGYDIYLWNGYKVRLVDKEIKYEEFE